MDISSLTHSKQNLSISQPAPFQQMAKLFFSCLGQKALQSLWTPLSDTHISNPLANPLAMSLKTPLSILSFFCLHYYHPGLSRHDLLLDYCNGLLTGLSASLLLLWSTSHSAKSSKLAKGPSKLSAQRQLILIGIKSKVFSMAYKIYNIGAPTYCLISFPTSQPLLYFWLTSSLTVLQSFQAHSYLRALGFAISSAWNIENYIVNALISLRSLFKCHFINESFPVNIASAVITLCTLK